MIFNAPLKNVFSIISLYTPHYFDFQIILALNCLNGFVLNGHLKNVQVIISACSNFVIVIFRDLKI